MDLLAHRYRPDKAEDFGCNSNEAIRLKDWIQDFLRASRNPNRNKNQSKTHKSGDEDDDFQEYSDTDSDCSTNPKVESINKCALITGPHGVGKTSLAYIVANELKLHVIESHPSEKRDFKLFSTLKLANQKGKINPIAKMFEAAKLQHQQQIKQKSDQHKKKKIKLNQPLKPIQDSSGDPGHGLSLSGDSSMLLFDDIDVVFEEDGPFMKSLVEFIKDSKRPIVLTATRSIEQIKETLVYFEHIHLGKPNLDECSKLLGNICKLENHKLDCRQLADHLSCDIRQCINRIHFYGNQADKGLYEKVDISSNIEADILKLDLNNLTCKDNDNLLACMRTTSFVDVIDNKLNLIDRNTLLDRWLDVKPSFRNEEYSNEISLANQIRDSILELNSVVAQDELLSYQHQLEIKEWKRRIHSRFERMGKCINEKVKSRIEPPDKEFFVDMIPYFCEFVKFEQENKIKAQLNGASSRRSRRNIGYLDTIGIYLDSRDFKIISDALYDVDSVL